MGNRHIWRRNPDRPLAFQVLDDQLPLPRYPRPSQIRKLRKDLGISQAIAAELALIAEKTYQRIEYGEVQMHPWVYERWRELMRAYWMRQDTLRRGEPMRGITYREWGDSSGDSAGDSSVSGTTDKEVT